MSKAVRLDDDAAASTVLPTLGVCAACDPRVDEPSRRRVVKIIARLAGELASAVRLPDGRAARVVYSTTLIDTEKQADLVARQFRAAPAASPSACATRTCVMRSAAVRITATSTT